jgi:hypothetical protein
MSKNEDKNEGYVYVDSGLLAICMIIIQRAAKPDDEIHSHMAEISKAMASRGDSTFLIVTPEIKRHIDAINEWMPLHKAEIDSVSNDIEKGINAMPGFSHANRLFQRGTRVDRTGRLYSTNWWAFRGVFAGFVLIGGIIVLMFLVGLVFPLETWARCVINIVLVVPLVIMVQIVRFALIQILS